MNLKNILFKNFSLKVFSLFLAIAVWVLITGKARSNIEKFINIDVEFVNVEKNTNIYSNPDKVRIKVKGSANSIKQLSEKDFAVKIDLSNIRNGVRNYYTRDFLKTEKAYLIESVHPTMIEVNVREIVRKSVPVKLRFYKIDNNKKRYYRQDRIDEIGFQYQIQPERVLIEGYRSDISQINFIGIAEDIPLNESPEKFSGKFKLLKTGEILKIIDYSEVEVHVSFKPLAQPAESPDKKNGKQK